MPIVNNLQEFLADRGFDDPFVWSRCFYKYNDIGPWVVFLLRDGITVYYEDRTPFDIANCVGIKVGSIVEGSDVSGTPFTMWFPFDTDKFEERYDVLDAECCFYWDRDNSNWYCVLRHGDPYLYVKECWGDWEWDENDDAAQSHAALRSAVEEMDLDGIQPGGEPLPIPGHPDYSIREYHNETTFD